MISHEDRIARRAMAAGFYWVFSLNMNRWVVAYWTGLWWNLTGQLDNFGPQIFDDCEIRPCPPPEVE